MHGVLWLVWNAQSCASVFYDIFKVCFHFLFSVPAVHSLFISAIRYVKDIETDNTDDLSSVAALTLLCLHATFMFS